MAGWKVLVVGGGSREHAFVWKLSQSPRVGKIFCAPGNGGTAALAENVPIAVNQVADLARWAATNEIDLVIVGPEEPLALGLVDRLQELGIPAFGPGAAAAQLESSKSWAKQVMVDAGVPTAAYRVFEQADAAWDYARTQRYPLVLKADGLAAGKGVLIANNLDEARAAIATVLVDQTFGAAGQKLVVEEFLSGNEVSLIAFVDGRTTVPLVPSCDHKRIGDGDTGANTGGMGAYAPTRLVNPALLDQLRAEILDPVVAQLSHRGLPYRGALYAGLMLTAAGPRVIEFNCRFGDPETQVILPLLDGDFAEIAYATATGVLNPASVQVGPGHRCGVVVASGGYPGPYAVGREIRGLEQLDPRALAFHAGTRRVDDTLVTSGGRVLTVVGEGESLAAARQHAYDNVARIAFGDIYYRRDIGWREPG
ncbi:MAG TPA: phosphoribosylamine--glycine ligase [Chloroflexota bacterium]|nr:phosphoribosylamine--glycine ligase [Chloroflexota bacterium]